MKYRRLTNDELAELENEFIRFLASNTITSQDWVKLKTETPTKAEELIEVFSDIVFEKILGKVAYMEHRETQDLRLFHCLEDKMILLGLRVAPNVGIDFTQKQTAEEMLSKFRQAPKGALKMYRAEKVYKPNRTAELFKMLENGCLISKGVLFKTLANLNSRS